MRPVGETFEVGGREGRGGSGRVGEGDVSKGRVRCGGE